MSRHPIVAQDLDRILAAAQPWADFAGATVLITGAAGQLPAYMAESLLRLNEIHPATRAKVIGLVRDIRTAASRFADYAGRDDLHLVQHDVRLPWPGTLSADFVIHAASPASPRQYGQDPIGTIEVNTSGMHHALDLARRSRSKGVLFISTSEVYGQLPAEMNPIKETDFGGLDPTIVRSCYAESKRLGECLCASWAAVHGVPAKIVRPFHTYGPGLRLNDGRVFSDFVGDVVAKRPIQIRGDGMAQRAFCYLADAIAGFFTVLLHGEPGQAYNVGNPAAECRVKELADLLVRLFPERSPSADFVDGRPKDGYVPSAVNRSCPDISKMGTLGWRPTVGLEDGFRQTVASCL